VQESGSSHILAHRDKTLKDNSAADGHSRRDNFLATSVEFEVAGNRRAMAWQVFLCGLGVFARDIQNAEASGGCMGRSKKSTRRIGRRRSTNWTFRTKWDQLYKKSGYNPL
jgi:hypothetical protein